MTDLIPTPRPPDEQHVQVSMQLRETRSALEQLTGGVPPRAVMAELAQAFASELAAYFDDLPMQRFTGRVPRVGGMFGRLVPARRVQHRVVLARYISVSMPWKLSEAFAQRYASIALIALGEDGVLRIGRVSELMTLSHGNAAHLDPVEWNDVRIRRVPTHSVRLRVWTGSADSTQVANPGRLIESLTAIAALVARESARDLAMLQKLL